MTPYYPIILTNNQHKELYREALKLQQGGSKETIPTLINKLKISHSLDRKSVRDQRKRYVE